MVNFDEIKYTMEILQKEIDKTNNISTKAEWVNYAEIYMSCCDETEQIQIKRQCQNYYQDMIDEDYDKAWATFFLAQSLQTCGDDNPKIIKLFESILEDERSSINDLSILTLNHLGICYRDGLGTEINFQKAYECFTKGIDLNNFADNYIYLGDLYFNGQYVEQDYNKAFGCYLKAYDITLDHPHVIDNRGSSRACALYKIGLCFLEGKGTRKDLDRAIDYLRDSLQTYEISSDDMVELQLNIALREKMNYVR